MAADTFLVHPPRIPGEPHGAVSTPIYQTATFGELAGGPGAFDYSRSGNPTRGVLEEQLARLDGAQRSFAFASGMAAVTAVCRLVSAGEEIIVDSDIYGGTWRLLNRILPRAGVRVRVVDLCDLGAVRKALTSKTRLVWVESPSNPLQRIADLRAIAALAHEVGAWLAVDNSLCSPLVQRPLDLGADFAIQSGTKFLGGHSDLTAGVVSVCCPDLSEQLYLSQNGEGTALAPQDCWLLIRGLQTLHIRIERQAQNTQRLVARLQAHPAVQRVFSPWAPDHPGRDLHLTQARHGGAVISFTTGSVVASQHVLENTRWFHTAVSFGGVASSISLPCRMSHAAVPDSTLPPDLVRVSVGIEFVDDLVADLTAALDQAAAFVDDYPRRPQVNAGLCSV